MLEIGNIVRKTKNAFKKLISRLKTAEETIVGLEDTFIEIAES